MSLLVPPLPAGSQGLECRVQPFTPYKVKVTACEGSFSFQLYASRLHPVQVR